MSAASPPAASMASISAVAGAREILWRLAAVPRGAPAEPWRGSCSQANVAEGQDAPRPHGLALGGRVGEHGRIALDRQRVLLRIHADHDRLSGGRGWLH